MSTAKAKPTASTTNLERCPKCGSTDTHYDISEQTLRCKTCRSKWNPDTTLIAQNEVANLKGLEISAGTKDTAKKSNDQEVMTLKCKMCHAEITLALTNESTIKCHWCRHTLSVADQIQNGINPDGILPFTLTKEKAQEKISAYLQKRRFFASPKFVAEFSLENIYPIYLPYLIVDANLHSSHSGKAAHLVKQYSQGSDKNRRTYYDYDLYSFSRDFNLTINDLTIEGNSNYADHNTAESTQNVINAIMPFDTKQLIPYSAQFLQGGFRSEKRNLNFADLEQVVNYQFKDISRHQIMDKDMKQYNHGIKFESDKVDTTGARWVTALLPVWLYSYLEVKSNGSQLLHYICVNGRTGETCGSVPINTAKLLMTSAIIEVLALILLVLFI
ncbi:TFIIB-type zinc ribbon-containing protein [Microgenomates group bacterium]|nr:TFIIB-type zinc ribbon-containing protein [Microgenomates group bacterium]